MINILRNPNDPRYIFLTTDPENKQDLEHIAALEKHMNKIPQYMLLHLVLVLAGFLLCFGLPLQ